MIVTHIRRLRSVPGCANSLFVIMPENMMCFEAEHLSEDLKKEVTYGYVIFEEAENQKGFKTDNMLKMSMAKAFRDLLDKRRVFFHNQFFTLTTPEGKFVDRELLQEIGRVGVTTATTTGGASDLTGSGALDYSRKRPSHLVMREAADNMRDTVIDQGYRYTRIVKPSNDEHKEATIIYSGKHNGPGDDIIVMTQAANTFHKYFLTRERYRQYWRHIRS